MPTSISDIESTFNLNVSKTLRWNSPIIEVRKGIYIITIGSVKDYRPERNINISLKDNQMRLWMQNAPSMTLNSKKPSIDELQKQLSKFWMLDESILYIGKAEKQSIQTRVSQFYRHKVGKRSPHKGGYWLKLLSDLNNYYIHILPTENSHVIEEQMLQYFIENVSDKAKMKLIDKVLCLPFANLQLRSGVRKKHGLNNHCQ